MKKKVLNVVIGILIGIGILEGYLRIPTYQPINRAWDCYRPDLLMYVTYEAGSQCPYRRFQEYDTVPRINNVGLRSDTNTTFHKPTGVKRVLILGDSIVAAHEVEERQTFSKLLENTFRDHGHYVEVLNGGIRGYSPLLARFYLKFQAIKFNPDIVVLFVNTADIADDRRYRQYARLNRQTKEIDSLYPNWGFYFSRAIATDAAVIVDKTPRFTLPSLRFWQLLKSNARLYFQQFFGFEIFPIKLISGDWKTDPLTTEREIIKRDNVQILLQQTEENIDQISQLTRSHGAVFVLVVFPMGHEVSSQEWDKGRESWGVKRNRVYPTYGLDAIKAWAKRSGFYTIDMKPWLQQGHELYFLPTDGHLNVQGHIKVAEALWHDLNSLNILKRLDNSFNER